MRTVMLVMLAGMAFGQDRNTARIPDPVPAKIKEIVKAWPECDEYKSKWPCRVTVNLGTVPDPDPTPETNAHAPLMPRSHVDVQVQPFIHYSQPKGEAAILLIHSSPFLTCTVSATPAAPGRDLSASVGSLLTAVAGIGAPVAAAGANDVVNNAFSMVLTEKLDLSASLVSTGNAELDAIAARIAAIGDAVDEADSNIATNYTKFRLAVKKYWKFTFATEEAATDAIDKLKTQVTAVRDALESFTKLGTRVSLADADLARWEKDHADAAGRLALRGPQSDLLRVKGKIDLVKAHIADFGDKQKLLLQLNDYLTALQDPTMYPAGSAYTMQALPMGYFSGKTVTETISCKDAVTKDPAFDNIIFTAYYEALPHLDISVGAIGSLLGGRQVGAVTTPFTPAQAAACAGVTTPCGASTLLGYSSRSSYQFMPGVFVEWRMKNFRCPWAVNGAPSHPAGYVCSIGVAGGVAINPNNGGPAAEFFEGVSFGIQRFSFILGAHTGRYQQYGGGYYAGEVFPPGTSVTPPTAYGWATHPGFAIAYRIPLR